MTRKYFSGNTLDQAVMLAARHYALEPSELAYRQLEKKHGFLRTRKSVMIVVDPENPRREPEADAEASPDRGDAQRPREPKSTLRGPEGAAAATAAAGEPWIEPSDSPEDPEIRPGVEEEPADEPAVWAADAEGSNEAPAADARPAYREAAPRDVTGDEELLQAAERASEILLRFAGIEAGAKARAAGERIEVEIEGPDDSVLVVEGGKGLLSIQHLLPRMMRGLSGRSSFVRADSRQFHQQRKERLEALAFKEADAASRNGRPRTLPPMAPDERRIVHLALKDSPTVVTESRGTGLHKRVVIRPADGFNEPGDVEARHGF